MKMLRSIGAAVFVAAMVVVALAEVRVSAETHHVLGGDGVSDVGSWLSGRVFRVGDKIWFNCSGTEESIVELQGPDEFHSCDITNPIKMYSDKVAHVKLDKEGTRYFSSGNKESCENGLKLPVSVGPQEYSPFPPLEPPPEPILPPPPAVVPPPSPPSSGNYLNGLSFVLFAAFLVCSVGM